MESAYATEMRKRVESARLLQADMAKYDEWLDGEVKDYKSTSPGAVAPWVAPVPL